MDSNTMIATSSDVASSIVTNTLLTSMKTGQPLIDAITSLVFVTKFKNQMFKNIAIVIVIIMGIVFHRITKSIDILMIIYNKLNDLYFERGMIPKILRGHKGNTYRMVVLNSGNKYYDVKSQYSFLFVLYRLVELYPNIQREFLSDNDIIGCTSIADRMTNLFTSYDHYEKDEPKYLNNIQYKLYKLRREPPKSNIWYQLTDDIQFKWSIHKPEIKKNDTNDSAIASTNTNTNITKITNNTKNSSDDLYYYELEFYSKNKENKDIEEYIRNNRRTIYNELVDFEKNRNTENEKIRMSNKNIFRGEICIINEHINENNNDNKNTEKKTEKKIYMLSSSSNTFSRPIESLFFKEKNQLMKIIETFKLKNGIYSILPHRHKLGILIYGPSGTGKTSLSLAIATEL